MAFSLISGAIFGLIFPNEAKHLAILGTLFSNALHMTIFPLVFLSVTLGIYRLLNGSEKMVRISSFFALSVCASSIVAAMIGLIAGRFISLDSFDVDAKIPSFASIEWSRFATDMIPTNIASALAGNNLLPVIVFAVIFGSALSSKSASDTAIQAFESISGTFFKIITWLITLSPLPIFAIMAVFFAEHGISVGLDLLSLVLIAYGALIVLFLGQCVFLLLQGENPLKVIRAVAEPMTLGFVTRSSEVTLPLHIGKLVKAGVPNDVASTMLPIAYTFNKNGSVLYIALLASAVAATNHIEFNWEYCATLVFLSIATIVGTINVPSGAMVALAAILSTLNMPIGILALIISIDALIDMPRTALNVFGNTAVVNFVARTRGVIALDIVND